MKFKTEHLRPYIGVTIDLKTGTRIVIDGINLRLNEISYRLEQKEYLSSYRLATSGMQGEFCFRRLSSIVNSITIEGRTFLPLRELERMFWMDIPEKYKKNLAAWLFDLIREGKVQNAPHRLVKRLCEWNFWIFEDEFFDEGIINELKD